MAKVSTKEVMDMVKELGPVEVINGIICVECPDFDNMDEDKFFSFVDSFDYMETIYGGYCFISECWVEVITDRQLYNKAYKNK